VNYAFLAAGGVAAFGLVLHLLLGRSRPFMPRSSDTESNRLLDVDAAFGRHAASLIFAAMALTYAHAARAPDANDAALTVSMLGILLAAIRAGLAIRAKVERMDAAEWAPLAVSGALGLAGLQM
jgi:hypothetical protein